MDRYTTYCCHRYHLNTVSSINKVIKLLISSVLKCLFRIGDMITASDIANTCNILRLRLCRRPNGNLGCWMLKGCVCDTLGPLGAMPGVPCAQLAGLKAET